MRKKTAFLKNEKKGKNSREKSNKNQRNEKKRNKKIISTFVVGSAKSVQDLP